jgi:RNA-directed DNA polymerase
MVRRESDRCIVPRKLDNPSSRTKPGNAGEGKASKLSREQVVPPTAPSGEPLVPSRLERITNRAEQHPEEAFNNLFTLLNVELLRMAFERLERNKAPGIDGRTVKDYEANLESNLQDLEQRLHRGTYRPLPSLRKEIPKGDGKTRPLALVPENAGRLWKTSSFSGRSS